MTVQIYDHGTFFYCKYWVHSVVQFGDGLVYSNPNL